MRTNKSICLYCFGDLNARGFCNTCKKRANDKPNLPHHVQKRTVLGGRYLIAGVLGAGGFGITYLAWDLAHARKVALKEFYPAKFVSRAPSSNRVIINDFNNRQIANRGLRHFVDEAKILSKLKDTPGIVSVYNFFPENNTAYMVMEFLDGLSLLEMLQKGGRQPIDKLLKILHPIAKALVAVHKLGLVHRDIALDNIIITPKSTVLIDFGAAKYSNWDGKSISVILKHGFAPPEQYDNRSQQGPWTDVYALAATIYSGITGMLPLESVQRLAKDTLQPPSELGISIAPRQEQALMRAMHIDPKKRYRDMQQLMIGLFPMAK